MNDYTKLFLLVRADIVCNVLQMLTATGGILGALAALNAESAECAGWFSFRIMFICMFFLSMTTTCGVYLVNCS